jgi:hypothetical protein
VPTYTNAILDGSTLYVWGVEYNAQGDKGEFFRSLSLAQWLGDGSVADSEPDAVVAPSANNAEGEAVASELADTSDKTNALALEAALALSLATCAAAATQIQRRRKKM